MLLSAAGCLFTGVILYISGVQGRASSICALRGSSVDLPCSAPHHTPTFRWFTDHSNGSKNILEELNVDGNHVTYNTSAESNLTLTIKNVTERDGKVYCCRERAEDPTGCRNRGITLHVTELQVKVIPTTEGQTVTLICSSSCALTENPAVYIWYKNGEFLYQDWSPWYQELVSSEEAVTYSCAIKGYEDLRAPQVSVDSVTSSCFKVTYAEGRMCSDQQKPENESCSITYPTELNIQRTPSYPEYVRLTCTPSCPLTDPHTVYRWYWNKNLYRYYEGENLTVTVFTNSGFSCAVKGHEDLSSAEVCVMGTRCETATYVSRRICVLGGSSVSLSAEYSFSAFRPPRSKLWYKIKRSSQEEAERLTVNTRRLEYYDSMNNSHILRITNLTENDSAEYVFPTDSLRRKQLDSPGVTLVVTGVTVNFSPSAVVTEDQRVTLTCSTSCPLTDNTNYIWFFNSRPLTPTDQQNKHLVLDPVSSQRAGNYSCAAKTQKAIRSHVERLTVQAREKSMVIMNAVRLAAVSLIPSPLLLFHLWIRWTRSVRTSQS